MQKTKRQHTVPRCYLSRFCKDGDSLFAFDKVSGRSFPLQAKDASVQTYFYDFPAEITAEACPGQDVDPQMVEKDFSRMEGVANGMLSEIIETANRRGIITPTQCEEIAPYIIIQSLRTARMRQLLVEMHEKSAHALLMEQLRHSLPEAVDQVDVTVTFDRRFLPIAQAKPIYDENLIVQLSGIILRHIWYIALNRSMQAFYTSDHPVVMKEHVFQQGRSFAGFRSPGIVIAFPLSSRHALVMLERTHHSNVTSRHRRAVVVDALEVDRLNEMQVLGCHRQVYCEADQFDGARHIRKMRPDTCVLDRPLMEVVKMGDTIGVLFRP